MQRTIFTEDHEAFRDAVRQFIAKEITPNLPDWEAAGFIPRDFYKKTAEIGINGLQVPEQYGGGGIDSFLFNTVVYEEIGYAAASLGGFQVHLNTVLPYFLEYANDEQRDRWFPGFADGALVSAIAMTEPGIGSDLAGVTTTAVRDGDDWILNGNKTFITGGINADLVIVVARTSKDPDNRRKGLSLLVVEADMPGFIRGRNLHKIGMKSSDTAELTFDNVRVPARNLLGEEGTGVRHARPQPAAGAALDRDHRPGHRHRRGRTSPSTTPRSAWSSASRWPTSRTPSSCSPSARPNCRPGRRWSTRR